MPKLIPRAAITSTILGAAHFATLQTQDAPMISFCDASFDLQNPTSSNQTGIGVVILTHPDRSILHASFFST
jgi:hypothetical protein